MRGGSRVQAKPRAKASASTKPRAQQQRKAKPAASIPHAKLRAAQGVGLSPAYALMGAAGVLSLALVVTLATGGRGERLVQATNSAIAGQFAHLGFKPGAFPVAEKVTRQCVSLPMYPHLSREEVEYVCEHIRAYFGK